jgi:2-aminophenol/2-amino-5-chlorophenol 1,6-dioxygenase alpha subunit
MPITSGFIVPGLPHPLLAPEKSPAWTTIRKAYDQAREAIARSDADLLVLYSTQWFSVIGHQIQADPNPKWVHVDQDWHALGSMPYEFRMDAEYAHAWEAAAKARGLHARTVSYQGFPIDTGSVVALKLLNPDNRLQACICSSNMYADRAETLVLGKAARDAIDRLGRKAIAVSVTALSSRLFPHPIDPAQDHVSSLKDDEWNRKILELLGEGRLEDVSQLARSFYAQANADQKFKAVWWLAALMGQHNRYEGKVYAYAPIWGTGAAVVELVPSAKAAKDQEFDEEDVDVYQGDRNVLTPTGGATGPTAPAPAPAPASTAPSRPAAPAAKGASTEAVRTEAAPKPVGPYPHARKVGDFVFVSGMGPRQPGTDAIPGGPVRDAQGNPLPYDVKAQTRATIENVKTVLEAAGASLDAVVDVTAFLIDMDRDFAGFNEVYREYFENIGPTRTTLAIKALPTPIAVELKVIARVG